MPVEASIIVTYRCPMKCSMCSIWKNPSQKEKEISPSQLQKLPRLKFINITGGEPFVRSDLDEIVDISLQKARRVVISTSGWYRERVIKLARRFPRVGIRVSIEGLSVANDKLRGKTGGFDRGLKLLLQLKAMGLRDIGFGITVSDENAADLLWLYLLSRNLNFEFATAVVHNSFYFHKYNNHIKNTEKLIKNFKKLIKALLRENNPKSWFRAYFNLGLINYIKGNKRLLPCKAGTLNFFIDPYGEVLPCNGLEQDFMKYSMGNISKAACFNDLWYSQKAITIREKIKNCPKNCWMIGTAAPVMKNHLYRPFVWVLKNKLKSLFSRNAIP